MSISSMDWFVPLALTWSVICGGPASASEPFTEMDLSGDWEFAYTPTRTAEVPPDGVFAAQMPVPACWDDQLDRAQATALWPAARFNPAGTIAFPANDRLAHATWPFLLGTGWYRRSVDVPTEWQNRQVTIHVGRVVMEAWVYLNGQAVDHHFGHSTDWEVNLTGKLNAGQPNRLVIAVDNTRNDRTGTVIRGWAGRSGGIFGPIQLRTTGTARIADVYVYPDAEQLHWRVEITGSLGTDAHLQWRIIDPQTGQNVRAGRQPAAGPTIEWTSETKGLEPWSDRRPKLYALAVEAWSATACQDVRRQPFGLRRLTAVGTKLHLNGSPIFLRGICDCAYFPLTCTPPTDVNWYREHIRRLKEIGFNWIRCHTWVPPEPYLQAADELGMVFQVEPPVGYEMPEWQDILRACRKHPSVVIYCCGNEEVLNEPKIEYLRRCAAELRRLVPDGLFNPQEAMRGVEYGTSAQLGQTVSQPFRHNATRMALVKQFTDVFGQYPGGRLSYNSLSGRADSIDHDLAIYERPCLSHELGICDCFIDLNLEKRHQNLRIGPMVFAAARKSLTQAGLLDRADLYYRNSAAWQRLIMKDAMETARACRLLAGYDCLGATDVHWLYYGYACGLLNEFDELKAGRSVEDTLSYNGESVLLIDRQRERNLQAGEPFEREISLSWFGEGALTAATLRWQLRTPDGTALAKGEAPVATVAPGNVNPIATLKAALPAIKQATKATLDVELTAANARIQNRWDYWLFPASTATPPSNVTVVDSLNAQTLAALYAGQRVVLLGQKPFPGRGLRFQMNLAGRVNGIVATVIAKHPLTDRFPHDGFCDWQFYPMFAKASAVDLDAVPAAFDPIVEVVNTYKSVRRQAAMFEWRVEQGRLLVCSLGLPPDDPAARYLRASILDYAAGDDFRPRTQLDRAALEKLIQPNATSQPESDIANEAFDAQGHLRPKTTQPATKGGKP